MKQSMLPNFLIPGFQKCGTTSVYRILKQHPQCFLPEVKEPFHFCHTGSERRLQTYAGYFENASVMSDCRAIGEGSTSYIVENSSLQRAYKALGPEIKLIVMVRNPIDRYVSGFRHMYKRYHENRSLNDVVSDLVSLQEENACVEKERKGVSEAIEEDLVVIKPYQQKFEHHYFPFNYYRNSLYVRHLSKLLDWFPRNQVHVSVLENWKDSAHAELTELLGFLDLDPFPSPDLKFHWNRTESERRDEPLDLELRRKLATCFKNSVEELEALLGLRLSKVLWEDF